VLSLNRTYGIIWMKALRVAITPILALSMVPSFACAQVSQPWSIPLGNNSSTVGFDSLKIVHAQPGWTPIPDIAQSDGTADVPDCASPASINSFMDGLVQLTNARFVAASGDQNPLDMAWPMVTSIYVHPSVSGGSHVCSTQIDTWSGGFGKLMNPQAWEWQDYAQNGKIRVQASPQN